MKQLLDHNKNLRYIMFRGAGTHFSGGADLKVLYEASKMGAAGLDYLKSFFREQYQLHLILSGMRTPLMTFLHGNVTASAGGLGVFGKYV